MIDEGELGKDFELIDQFYQPRGRLNGKEQDEALMTLIERHGAMCFNCLKEGWILKIEDDAIRDVKGLPPRKRPILVVHELVRGIFHDNKDGEIIKWGGCRPACYSCNNKLGSVEPKLIDKKTMTWQAKQSLKRNIFKKTVDSMLAKKIHVCKNMIINRLSDDDKLDCSQEMLVEAMKQRIGNKWDLIDITEFNIQCNYCESGNYSGDNKHIISKGKPPTKQQTDIERMLEEEGEQS